MKRKRDDMKALSRNDKFRSALFSVMYDHDYRLRDVCKLVFEYACRPTYFSAEWFDEVDVSAVVSPDVIEPDYFKRFKPINRDSSWKIKRITDHNVLLQCKGTVSYFQTTTYGLSIFIDDPETIDKWYEFQVALHMRMRESIMRMRESSIVKQQSHIDPDLIITKPLFRPVVSNHNCHEKIVIRLPWRKNNLPIIYLDDHQSPGSLEPCDLTRLQQKNSITVGFRFLCQWFQEPQNSYNPSRDTIECACKPKIEWIILHQ
jgi:hypothetical protein